MELINAIGTTLFESDNYGGWKISGGVIPTLRAEKVCAGIIEVRKLTMAEVNVLGQMDNTIDHTFESANRVYDDNGISPTVNTCGGGGLEPKVVEVKHLSKCIGGLSSNKWGSQYHQQDRVYEMGDIALAHPANIPGGSYNYLEVKKMTNAINDYEDGTSRTIKSQYGNTSVQNLVSTGTFGATGAVEIDILGNYMPSNYDASVVVGVGGGIAYGKRKSRNSNSSCGNKGDYP